MDLTYKCLNNAWLAYGASLAIHGLSFLLLTPDIRDLKARASYININAVFRTPTPANHNHSKQKNPVGADPCVGPRCIKSTVSKPAVAAVPEASDDEKIINGPQIKSRKPKLLNGESIKIDYPARARLYKIEGSVRLKLTIAESGRVKKAEVMSGPAFGLKEAALLLAKKLLFSPATDEAGNEIIAEVEHEVVFRLKKAS